MDAKLLIVAAVMGAGMFGNVDLPDELTESLPSLVVYRYDDEMVKTRKTVGQNDDEYKILSQFLLENKAGWEYDARNYAQKILFKGPNYSINFMSDGVVINYQNEKGEWKQISKSCKQSFCGLSDQK